LELNLTKNTNDVIQGALGVTSCMR
jgi:hypothetical protein